MNIAKIIDQTFLKKEANENEIKKVCQEAKKYGFRGLCVFPEYVLLAKKLLKDSGVKLTALLDEPTGSSFSQDRLKMAKKIKEYGSDEIDVVMKIDSFKNGKYEEVLSDLKNITKILPTKVIIGSGYLTDEEIKKASELVKESGAICVKTATLQDPIGHEELAEKAKHIKIMKESASGLLIKASGVIRNLADAKLMVASGADIIGTSSGVEIVKEAIGQKIGDVEAWRKIE